MLARFAWFALLLPLCGCTLFPDISHQPQFHNPFPQFTRVAVLPFANQSTDPTISGRMVAGHYRNELQKIPGFEVMPMGVVEVQLESLSQTNYSEAFDFQQLARELDVDVVVVGAVTDFSEYYPPRIGLSTSWYAANPSFHPIPPGYGLPWGTPEEEYIPDTLVLEAEHALAREQLKTQTPPMPAARPRQASGGNGPSGANSPAGAGVLPAGDKFAGDQKTSPEKPPGDKSKIRLAAQMTPVEEAPGPNAAGSFPLPQEEAAPIADPYGQMKAVGLPPLTGGSSELPIDWPDPRGFVPPPPQAERPAPNPQSEPVIRQLRQYNGADANVTAALENYHRFRNEARGGGWQAYLQRKEDFIQFCCYLHITEMLAARGGTGETRVVWRWPLDR
ncbi:hypothetical protein [Lignipirellula cremea]|uniref:Lipoprotein n=1 Tax=Lignipirellula cremea TaxID=2528010 RepID=A0A518DR49_9BACT|nr:hypothetical protein [Lignipirellula cremea]QDU94318.1 hypothetical protein Pla8534_21070 [Lignipirellula cremea]